MIINEGIFSELTPFIQQKISDFQFYIKSNKSPSKSGQSKVKSLIQDIGHGLAGDYLPINVINIANQLNVKIQFNDAKPNISGKILPIKGGFCLTVYGQTSNDEETYSLPLFDKLHNNTGATTNTIKLTPRGRFTVAHELGHIFFFNTQNVQRIPKRIMPHNHLIMKNNWREEGLCHDFARALLMPDIYKHSFSEPSTLAELIDIVKQFNVSVEPAVRRILYDWKKSPNIMFVSIYQTFRGRFLTNCYRGQHRKQIDDFSPSRSRISQWITKAGDLDEVRHLIGSRFSLDADSAAQINNTLWLVI